MRFKGEGICLSKLLNPCAEFNSQQQLSIGTVISMRTKACFDMLFTSAFDPRPRETVREAGNETDWHARKPVVHEVGQHCILRYLCVDGIGRLLHPLEPDLFSKPHRRRGFRPAYRLR